METSKMQVIIADRRAGKTTALIRRAAAVGGYIVCVNHRRAVYVRDLAAKLGVSIPFPLTLGEVLNHQFVGRNCAPFHMDDADDLLRALVDGQSVATVTLTSVPTDP